MSSTDDFIEVYDGYYSNDAIDDYIKYFDDCEENNLTYTRVTTGHKKHEKDDTQISIMTAPTSPLHRRLQRPAKGEAPQRFNINMVSNKFLEVFWNTCYPQYAEKYSMLQNMGGHSIVDVLMQKTSPGQGYHTWHSEVDDISTRNRILAFSLYLNDVEEGGETEFLYQKRRIKAKRGRLAIWPAYFTHAHRGNPPLSGDKYIITGWVEFSI